jgi:hypothetical protein
MFEEVEGASLFSSPDNSPLSLKFCCGCFDVNPNVFGEGKQ